MQVLARIVPLRDFFLEPANYRDSRSQLVTRFGELMRKIWNPRNFKGQVLGQLLFVSSAAARTVLYMGCNHHRCQRTWLLPPAWHVPRPLERSGAACPDLQVSPHEFMQAVMSASDNRFTIEKQSDPVEFFAWLLNTLHLGLTGGKRKRASIITRCFQGELQITTEAGTGAFCSCSFRPPSSSCPLHCPIPQHPSLITQLVLGPMLHKSQQ